MADLHITNWDRWQSYRRDRGQPPWIKIHRCVMRNPDWVALTADQRGQLVCLWLLAADHDGVIPTDPLVLMKLCHLDTEPDIKLFMSKGFIDFDAKLASRRRQHDAPETETETEKERIYPSKKQKRTTNNKQEFAQFWQAYPRKVGKKAAERAFARAITEVSSLAVMLAALATDAGEWKEERFTPHPATWLNQGRYLDRAETTPMRGYRPPGWTDDDERKLEHDQQGNAAGHATEAADLLDESAGVRAAGRVGIGRG